MILIDSKKKITNLAGAVVHSPFVPQCIDSLMDPEQLKMMQNDRNLFALRQMDAPFQLLLQTYREDSEAIEIIITQLSPDQTLYVSSEYQNGDFNIDSFRKLHRHDFFELLFVLEGEIFQNIENERHYYPEGSCCLLNQNVYHTEEKNHQQRLLFLQMKKEYLESLIHSSFLFEAERSESWKQMLDMLQSVDGSISLEKAYLDFIPVKNRCGEKNFIYRKMEELFRLLLAPTPGATFHANGLILEIFCRLFDKRFYIPAPIRFATSKEELLFKELTDYLNSCHGRAGRAELIERFHYSGDYLYKLTKKFTGLSLSDYAMSICLKEAARLLSTTDLSVSEIIDQLGFSNKTHFYNHFRKRFGTSPAGYRTIKSRDSVHR